MALTRVDHIRKLNQCAIPELVGVVAGLRGVLRSACDEDAAVVCLNRTESDRNHEVNV